MSLKKRLLEKSIELLEKRGFDRLSFREVAKECGVSHNAPYSHFKNRKEILEEIAKIGFLQFREKIDEIVKEENGVDRVLEIGVFYVKSAIEHKELWKLMFEMSANSSNVELLQIVGETFQVFTAQLDGNLDLALQLWSTVHGFATLYNSGNFDKYFSKDRTLDETIRDILITKIEV